jgi:group I intron endonuclease
VASMLVTKITGIYKIVSPSNKIYIGQSIDIEKRWVEHKRFPLKNKLTDSFKKHGFENHTFEVIEECEVDLLNERERYWQDFYDVLSLNGLNLRLTKTDDKSGFVSQETKDKISEYRKTFIFTEEHRRRIGLASKNMSQETRDKISAKLKGIKRSKEFKNKVSIASSKRTHTEETKIKIGKSSKERYRKPVSEETRLKLSLKTKAYWNAKKSKDN